MGSICVRESPWHETFCDTDKSYKISLDGYKQRLIKKDGRFIMFHFIELFGFLVAACFVTPLV